MQKLEQHIFVILSHMTHDGQLDIAIRKQNQFLLAYFKYIVHTWYGGGQADHFWPHGQGKTEYCERRTSLFALAKISEYIADFPPLLL